MDLQYRPYFLFLVLKLNILNSIDAKAKAIAIRVNLITFTIQVVDNGDGITKENLKFVGTRYMTNKCFNIKQLEHSSKFYGFRGEALASIVEISKSLNISSKPKHGNETHNVVLKSDGINKISKIKNRPSHGTTVTVEGFLNNIPIRQKQVNKVVEIGDIKRKIESLILIHPEISFSLRDDSTGHLLLNCKKTSNIKLAFVQLFPKYKDEFTILKVNKNNICVEGLIHKELSRMPKFQYLYVNKRPISCPKLENIICSLFKKFTRYENNKEFVVKKKYPIFVINIKCPRSKIDIPLTSSKTIVNFKSWEILERCIEKLICCYFGKETKLKPLDKLNGEPSVHVNRNGISQVAGMVSACAYKEKEQEKVEQHDILERDNYSEQEAMLMQRKNIYKKGKKHTEDMINKAENRNNKEKCKNRTTNTTNRKNITGILKNSSQSKKSSNYNIEDSQARVLTLKPFLLNSKFKKPLPVTRNVDNHINKNNVDMLHFETNTNNQNRKIIDHPDLSILDENMTTSNFSTFNVDENKGKKLIMNMFLKSTQAYDSQYSVNSAKNVSDETVEESNFYIENTVNDNVRGFNTTMSISMNIKRTKMKRKRNFGPDLKTENVTKNMHASSKERKMVSKYVQTSFSLNDDMQLKSTSIIPIDDKNAENYTVVFDRKNTLQSNPKLKFVYKKNSELDNTVISDQLLKYDESVMLCNCKHKNARSKIFSFKKSAFNVHSEHSIISENQSLSPIAIPSMSENSENAILKINRTFNNITQKRKVTPHHSVYYNQMGMNVSPYFKNKKCVTNDSYEYISCDQANQTIYPLYTHLNDNVLPQPLGFNWAKQEHNKNQISSRFINESNFYEAALPTLQFSPLFEHFQPPHQSTQANKSTEKKYFNFQLSNQNDFKNKFLNHDSVDMDISKEAIYNTPFVSKEYMENKYPANFDLVESSLTFGKGKNELANTGVKYDIQNEETNFKIQKSHIEQDQNNLFCDVGRNKINQHDIDKPLTGTEHFVSPIHNEYNFVMEKRLGFVPKGLSPLLKDHEPINQTLSQRTKGKLHEMILESYQNELLLVKWGNCINKDPKIFFEEIYKDKTKMYEEELPILNIKKSERQFIQFGRNIFANLAIIGQVDKKFIAVEDRNSNLILLFDQHAIHERIRLEYLLKVYKSSKTPSQNSLMFFIPQNDIKLLKEHMDYLDFVGLKVDFFSNGLNVLSIPLCLNNKCNIDSHALTTVIQALINEILQILKSTSGAFAIPRIIQEAINSEACRGAIKFGDELTRTECKELLADLALCNLPFQCAHGRPSVTPIVSLNQNVKMV